MAHPYEWPDAREDRARRDAYRRYDEPGDWRGARWGMESARLREGLERGWRRMSAGVRHTFSEDPGAYGDGDRAGGMFGGHDRPGSLFSHDEGLGGGLRLRPVGPHRGKGPKGYVRADARILEDVSDRLADDDRLDASDIAVKVEAGEVTLDGRVQSRADKRRAEDLAEQVSGVKHLQNNLRVRPTGTAATETRRAASMAGAAVGSAPPSPSRRTH